MLIFFAILWASHLLLPSNSLNFIDIPQEHHTSKISNDKPNKTSPTTVASSLNTEKARRYLRQSVDTMKKIEEEHDKHLKTKISILVQQTIHDTTKKIESIQNIKSMYRNMAGYKAGFLINLVKKSKDVVNELFSVGVKHKDDWKALEQMKTYELLVHANVDTDNLVKQLVEIHSADTKVDKGF